MTQFMMMRINYDDRPNLESHRKYTSSATQNEHQRIINRYNNRKPHIGGFGFHECLNFAPESDGQVRIYIPPSCVPGIDRLEDDFVIFSFTYSSDPVLPNRIVGVQAGVVIADKNGRVNPTSGGTGHVRLLYHGSGPTNLSTLFVPPLTWDRDQGRFLPKDFDWRMGRKYFDGIRYPAAILRAAHQEATKALLGADTGLKKFLQRQIEVIERIQEHYITVTDRSPTEDVEGINNDPRIAQTMRRMLIDARIGQGKFRSDIDKRWGNACAVTGCDVREALRASHVKAWKLSSHSERLDGRNGLLLVATLDALFDRHLISFEDNGKMLVGPLSAKQKKVLGLPKALRRTLSPGELKYLQFHREIFEVKRNSGV